MATSTKTPSKVAVMSKANLTATKTYEGLSRAQMVEAYRTMHMSRKVDDREILLKRQQKIFFQISGLDTKLSASRPDWHCAPLIGITPTIATAPCA
jgi:hypothetical protein